MSKAVTLADVLKSAPSGQSSWTPGRLILQVNSLGEIFKESTSRIIPILSSPPSLDDIEQNSISVCDPSTTGGPLENINGGFALSLLHGSSWYMVQFLLMSTSGNMYFRNKVAGTWERWQKVSTTFVT